MMQKYSNIIFTQGMIIAWYGYPNYIPKGWVICDGWSKLRNSFQYYWRKFKYCSF